MRGLVSDAADRFVVGASLRTDEEAPRSFEVETVKVHKGDYLMTLAGISGRDEAERLVGTQFHIGLDERRALDDAEWWAEDLIGCAVVAVDGSTVGEVIDVVTGAAQDRLVVAHSNGETFEVPFVDALVPDVEIDLRRVTVDLPPGLIP